MKNEVIARVCHEVNRAYCQACGDNSILPWDEESEDKRVSIISGVEYAVSGDRSPEEMHQAWLAGMEQAGWKYGDEKDEEERTHPCMLPYEELPLVQRIKDHLFTAVVQELQNVAPEKVVAPPAQVGQADGNMVCIGYIGFREVLNDPLYGTGRWTKNEAKLVSAEMADKLLKHKDQFELVVMEEGAEPPEVVSDPDKEEEILDDENEIARDTINQMKRKAPILDFAKNNFGIDLDKEATVKQLQESTIGLVDQFGMPGGKE